MSRLNRKKNQISKTQPLEKNSSPIVQPHLQQNYMHLQTVLMLAQFNSTFYQLTLRFSKSTYKCQQRYTRLKMMAFLKIKHYRPDYTDLIARKEEYKKQQLDMRKLIQEDGIVGETIPLGWQKGDLLRQDKQVLTQRVLVCCKQKLLRLVKIIRIKKKKNMASGFHRILQAYERVSAPLFSQKSSRIDTNDSQKSKIGGRSISRKPKRKSFSMQKGGKKGDSIGNNKYHRKPGSSEHIEDHKSVVSANLNKFLHDRGDQDFGSQKRQRDMRNSRSYKKFNISLASSQREELIRQLEYLRGKYKKIIQQFNGFSDRFLKVIEEEDNAQRE